MQIEVKVPALSESVSEASLVSWHKKAGDQVKRAGVGGVHELPARVQRHFAREPFDGPCACGG